MDQRKGSFTQRVVSVAAAALILMAGVYVGRASAGGTDPPGDPNSIGAQMVSLDQIYQRLNTGASGTVATAFVEPSTPPISGTMHTLNEIIGIAPAVDNTNGATRANVLAGKKFWGLTSGQWALQTGTAAPAGVGKSGQTTKFANRDDGDLEPGREYRPFRHPGRRK
jgi:hypothetical protein